MYLPLSTVSHAVLSSFTVINLTQSTNLTSVYKMYRLCVCLHQGKFRLSHFHKETIKPPSTVQLFDQHSIATQRNLVIYLEICRDFLKGWWITTINTTIFMTFGFSLVFDFAGIRESKAQSPDTENHRAVAFERDVPCSFWGRQDSILFI